jgi:SnoaL-like domain
MVEIDAEAFAAEWIAAWNSHDLERILSHYSTDIVLLSPIAQQRMGDGRVVGIDALRKYWRLGLASQLDLKFELIEVLCGHRCLTLTYRNHRGKLVCETAEFGGDGKIVRAYACYGGN